MPWYAKIGFSGAVVYLTYAFTRHEHGGGSTGIGPVCPFPQHWDARDGICTESP
jgi:hypothetical protein